MNSISLLKGLTSHNHLIKLINKVLVTLKCLLLLILIVDIRLINGFREGDVVSCDCSMRDSGCFPSISCCSSCKWSLQYVSSSSLLFFLIPLVLPPSLIRQSSSQTGGCSYLSTFSVWERACLCDYCGSVTEITQAFPITAPELGHLFLPQHHAQGNCTCRDDGFKYLNPFVPTFFTDMTLCKYFAISKPNM